jgi:predicted nucleotidyltransferase
MPSAYLLMGRKTGSIPVEPQVAPKIRGGAISFGVMTPDVNEQGTAGSWKLLLKEHTEQATDVLSRVQGVCGIILAGSVGRGEPWPLSDIDLVIIYEDEHAPKVVQEVEARRLELLDWWAAEGICTTVDAGKLAFDRSEVEQALRCSPAEATRYLSDGRWFHSLDKAYRGRAVFDPEGLASALSAWLTEARFSPEVVRQRLEISRHQALTHVERAAQALSTGDYNTAGVVLRESLHALMRYLMEGWGERDNSWGRFGTRFERTAAAHGESLLAQEIMSLYNLSPPAVAYRMAVAPQGILHRHTLSLQARRLVGEQVETYQDARDVLLSFATREVRYQRPPFEAWVGLDVTPAAVAERLERQRRLIAKSVVKEGRA